MGHVLWETFPFLALLDIFLLQDSQDEPPTPPPHHTHNPSEVLMIQAYREIDFTEKYTIGKKENNIHTCTLSRVTENSSKKILCLSNILFQMAAMRRQPIPLGLVPDVFILQITSQPGTAVSATHQGNQVQTMWSIIPMASVLLYSVDPSTQNLFSTT